MSGKVVCTFVGLLLVTEQLVLANGGPFLIRHPTGVTGARGGLAPILADLMPGRETQLEVVKEDLGFYLQGEKDKALVDVTARYTIRNPGKDDISLDIGFPVVRGTFLPASDNKGQLYPWPTYEVTLDQTRLSAEIIKDTDILTRIRKHSYAILEHAMGGDGVLRPWRERWLGQGGARADRLQKEMIEDLIKDSWYPRDARLLANFFRAIYAESEVGAPIVPAQQARPAAQAQRPATGPGAAKVAEIPFIAEVSASVPYRPYLGPLVSVGELKATQLLSHLAGLLAPDDVVSYERIFSAWGGDVREQSVDLGTGALRPRRNDGCPGCDETLYARVDTFDPAVVIDPGKRQACQQIAADLPVTFTYAPMSLIRTRVTIPRASTHVLTFRYKHVPYRDTATPESYQLAYVVHPATFWSKFGPINVEARVPEGVAFRASTGLKRLATNGGFDVYRGVLESKTGELLIAAAKAGWDKAVAKDPGRYQIQDRTGKQPKPGK
jgi:hypothetical protein